MITATSDEHFMRQALKEAEQAFKVDEVPVGAVIVWGDRIIARAHNLTERLNDVTAHAEMQAITYREFLPVLLGPNALPPYRGYKATVNPTISNEFATAAYRLGHSLLSPTLLRLDATGTEIAAGLKAQFAEATSAYSQAQSLAA